MNEKIAAALRKITEDEALLAKLQACADPDEAYAIVSSVENGFTKEEFIAALEALRASAQNNTDVSNEELSKMAGGIDLSLPANSLVTAPHNPSYAATFTPPFLTVKEERRARKASKFGRVLALPRFLSMT